MATWTDEYGRERYTQGSADESGDDYPTRAQPRGQRTAWYSGNRGDDSWRRGEEEIARYESRYPQARFRSPAPAGERRPWGESGWAPGRREPAGEGYARPDTLHRREANGQDSAPGGRGYVSGYANGYADGYRAGQQARARGAAMPRPGMADAAGAGGTADGAGYERGRRVGPKGYRRSDERLREDVCERLARNHALDVSEVVVSVSGGIVTLDGTVTERHVKHEIEEVADDVFGVTEVINQIRVRPYGVLASE
ncbi:BON domain-containing protein [Cupriavidus sp. 30B13]|uniref:BON domain-containing protein n=1 Tax=Cupriavidus sp. 30B13 TaxID=3384241 RepID=UPI003B8FB42E